VTYDEGEKFAKENGLMFLETSARTAYNVEEVNICLICRLSIYLLKIF
jgi:Ras-related protein Rab-2A